MAWTSASIKGGCKSIIGLLPPLNFITIHYAYFIITCLITSIIFWGSSDPGKSISYVDSLFLVVSAMTEAGLNTVNLSTMTSFQQAILWSLMILGSTIFVSIWTVLTRKRVFEQRFKNILKAQKEAHRMPARASSRARHSSENSMRAREIPPKRSDSNDSAGQRNTVLAAVHESFMKKEDGEKKPEHVTKNASPVPDHIRFMPALATENRPHSRRLSFAGVGAHPMSASWNLQYSDGMTNRRHKIEDLNNASDPIELVDLNYAQYLNKETTGRNGEVYNLSREEREHLGGVEYQAIKLLSYLVPIYFIFWQFFGCLGLAVYIAHNRPNPALKNGINPIWLGIFNGVSAFNNSGMSLLDANMIPFQNSTYTLMTMGVMILAGNTAYPLFLRLILWTTLKVVDFIYPGDRFDRFKSTLRFVLQYPRRVYTNLFPSGPTWWLFFMVVTLNSIDWAAFELLNIGNPAVLDIPYNSRVLAGLFQALAVRSGGFYIISIPTLRIGLQVLYMIMMYISVYPVVITIRHSNIYEERSLGIYSEEPSNDHAPARAPEESRNFSTLGRIKHTFIALMTLNPSSAPSTTRGREFLKQQVRGQLAHDLWWLVLAVLFISCIEVSNFEQDPVTYSVFNIAFELVSGYGCVGISIGLPNQAYSFSGGWSTSSKLILCAVMIRGRHRGLPVALDHAIRLSDHREALGAKEEEDARMRKTARGSLRRKSSVTTV